MSVGHPRLARPLAAKEQFVAALRDALDEGRGYAAGKVGETERAFLRHPIVVAREHDPRRLAAFELVLAHKALRHSGIFPTRPDFLREFGRAYAESARQLDSVGVPAGAWPLDEELFRFHGLVGTPIDYIDQEPDRSLPGDEARCYLPLLRGRRLLLVCPFAELLRARATPEIFEAVWRNTGKPWFAPASVEALEQPYGFSRATQEQYPTVLDLLAEIDARIDARTFDVALIAAGMLGSMIATGLKSRGKVAISLGGHLQVLFGVAGRRWLERPSWRRDYINDAWIGMPERYRPAAGESHENYW